MEEPGIEQGERRFPGDGFRRIQDESCKYDFVVRKPFATDKSEVDANEEESRCHPEHQTDRDVGSVEEYK